MNKNKQKQYAITRFAQINNITIEEAKSTFNALNQTKKRKFLRENNEKRR